MPKVFALERCRRGQARVMGGVRGQDHLTVDTGLFLQRPTNHLHGALLRQADQPAGDRRHAEVDIAGGDGDGHRLGSLEELEFHIEPSLREVAALKGNEAGRVAGKSQCTDLDLLACKRRRPQRTDGRDRSHSSQRLTAAQGDAHLRVLPVDRRLVVGQAPPGRLRLPHRRLQAPSQAQA